MLQVKSRFPGGNGRVLEVKSQGEEALLRLAPDAAGGRVALWFHARLSHNGKGAAPRRLRLVLEHLLLPDAREDWVGLRPVWRVKGQDWQRMLPGRWEVLADGQGRLTWEIDYPDAGEVELATVFPYMREDLEATLKKTKGAWQSDAIGLTGEAMPLARLANQYGEAGGKLPGLYFLARQQAGEHPGSWVLDGFLQALPRVKHGNVLAWGVPFADADGVFRGHCGYAGGGKGFEAAWGAVPARTETAVLQADIARWEERCGPGLGLDFGAGSTGQAAGFQIVVPSGEDFPEVHAQAVKWANVIQHALPPEYVAGEFLRIPLPGTREGGPGSALGWFASRGLPMLRILAPYTMSGQKVLSRKCFREVGQALAEAVARRLVMGS